MSLCPEINLVYFVFVFHSLIKELLVAMARISGLDPCVLENLISNISSLYPRTVLIKTNEPFLNYTIEIVCSEVTKAKVVSVNGIIFIKVP